ncbi:RNA-binding (RRM/RBD/RNP motifs) family protein [Striga asiatica]|uniref:RNA-binding (RRM/RBD/RNP motifs) family protein n=1 Tax=Striga asiatica TaxID=4170 RepID=A0A5A7P444_STRAF|nr:RNA-binding (RRM/RBD/RNP motifs) family protein [Striga asiatica]
MVLSNKKLKQKLRAAKAECLVATEAENNMTRNSEDLKSNTPNSLRTILNQEAHTPILSKREKRRQRVQIQKPDVIENGRMGNGADANEQHGSKLDGEEVKKKKRKRQETEASEDVKEKNPKQVKKKKKNKKKKKPKNKAGNEKVNEEGVDHSGSEANAEQLASEPNKDSKRAADVSDKVYVGGIPYYSTEDDIRSYFEGCGTITCVDCMTFPDTGKFRGIAIITFKVGCVTGLNWIRAATSRAESSIGLIKLGSMTRLDAATTEAAAKRALALDGSDMGGLFLKIQPYKSSKVKNNQSPAFSPSVMEGYNRIYVGNLSWDVTEEDLRNLFSDCTIESIRFGEDKETGEFKGYAHVDFGDSLSLRTALKLDQKIVCGRPVRISCAVPKKGVSNNLKSRMKNNEVHTGNFSVVNDVQITAVNEATNAVSAKVTANSDATNAVSAKVTANSDATNAVSAKITANSEATNAVSAKVTAGSEATNAVSSKIRRRTCYECGERGHISSLCPKRKDDDSKITETGEFKGYANVDFGDSLSLSTALKLDQKIVCGGRPGVSTNLKSGLEGNEVHTGNFSVVNEVQTTAGNEATNAVSAKVTANSEVITAVSAKITAASEATNAVSSKIRRRTCYECGERGHISSLCPKRKDDD